MEGGRTAEQGTHDELLARDSCYRKLCSGKKGTASS